MIFFAPGTLVDPPLAPTVRGPGCPPGPPSDHRYGCLGVSLGESEAWKPQKVGGYGWTRCPQNSVLSHVAQDTARSWFWACLTRTMHIQAIFSPFWAVLGHIVELEDNKGLFVTRKSRRTWCVATVSLRLAVLTRFQGRLRPKKSCFGAQNVQFWKGTSRLGAPALGRHQ